MKTILSIFALTVASSAFTQKRPIDFHLDKEYKISATGTIKLYTHDANVIITGSTRETAHVKIDRVVTTKGWTFGNDTFNVDVVEDAGGLTIKQKAHSYTGVIGYSSEKYTILLELPATTSLTVHGDDGDYKVKNINGAISFDLDDADVELTDCKGNDFYFNMDDGHVNMNGGSGKLEIKGEDTDVRVTNGTFSSMVTSTDDGHVAIETSLADNGDYRIKAEDGSVTFSVNGGGGKIEVRHEDGHVSADSKFELKRDTDEEKLYTLANGTASVSIQADDARVKLISR